MCGLCSPFPWLVGPQQGLRFLSQASGCRDSQGPQPSAPEPTHPGVQQVSGVGQSGGFCYGLREARAHKPSTARWEAAAAAARPQQVPAWACWAQPQHS